MKLRHALILLAAGALHGTSAWAADACPPLLNHSQPRLQDEKPVNLCGFSGQVLLVVNTASFCGYTSQYKALEALHARYQARGLAVLGFPSNDFGQQEPGSNKDIADFCENTFGVKFPMFAKSSVVAGRPGGLNPLFAQLAQAGGTAPKWNFHKYLIDRRGKLVAQWGSSTDPQDPQLTREIERQLAVR